MQNNVCAYKSKEGIFMNYQDMLKSNLIFLDVDAESRTDLYKQIAKN